MQGSHLFWFESNSSSSPSGLLPLEGCQVQATTVVDAVADEPYCIRITVFDQLLDVCRHGAITVAAASEDLQVSKSQTASLLLHVCNKLAW